MKRGALQALLVAGLLGGLDGTIPENTIDAKTGNRQGAPELTVGQIRFDRAPKPTGMVKIWAWRKKAWRVSEPVDASAVQWSRLMKYDRVEILEE